MKDILKRWRVVFLTALLFSLIILNVFRLLPDAHERIFDIYTSGLRTPLFSAFFTVGGFLLTLKTAILIRIKDVYETQDYLEDWKILQESTPEIKQQFYRPLRFLGEGLLLNVFFALFSALLQMTFGFIRLLWTISICLGFALTTICLLIFLWIQITQNLVRWFDKIEQDKENELKKQEEDEQKERQENQLKNKAEKNNVSLL